MTFRFAQLHYKFLNATLLSEYLNQGNGSKNYNHITIAAKITAATTISSGNCRAFLACRPER